MAKLSAISARVKTYVDVSKLNGLGDIGTDASSLNSIVVSHSLGLTVKSDARLSTIALSVMLYSIVLAAGRVTSGRPHTPKISSTKISDTIKLFGLSLK